MMNLQSSGLLLSEYCSYPRDTAVLRKRAEGKGSPMGPGVIRTKSSSCQIRTKCAKSSCSQSVLPAQASSNLIRYIIYNTLYINLRINAGHDVVNA